MVMRDCRWVLNFPHLKEVVGGGRALTLKHALAMQFHRQCAGRPKPQLISSIPECRDEHHFGVCL